jgi:hypothetical protein
MQPCLIALTSSYFLACERLSHETKKSYRVAESGSFVRMVASRRPSNTSTRSVGTPSIKRSLTKV